MPKIQNKTPTGSKSSGNKIQTGASHHQLEKKNSAAALVEKQLEEARLQAEKAAKEKVKRERQR